MKPAFSQYGVKLERPAVEEMQVPKMEFRSDADANKYARWVMGNNCFALKVDE